MCEPLLEEETHSQTRITALVDFQKAAAGRTTQQILSSFLDYVVRENDICDEGSLYRINRSKTCLKPYESIFSQDPGGQLPRFSDNTGGLAWRAFQTNRIKWLNNISSEQNNDEDYVETADDPVAIKNIVCVPIEIPQQTPGARVIGVANFHNNEEGRPFRPGDIEMLKAYVLALGFALAASRTPVDLKEKLFIVHGHDHDFLETLIVNLRLNGVPESDIVVLQTTIGEGGTLIECIEEQVQDCIAGFVLLTPDDVGRSAKDPEDSLRARARQNVIFEAGMLCQKWRQARQIAFLTKSDGGGLEFERPSDLDGLRVIDYDRATFEQQIGALLRAWGHGAANP